MNLYSYNDQWEYENQDIINDDDGFDECAQRMADNWGISIDEAIELMKNEKGMGEE